MQYEYLWKPSLAMIQDLGCVLGVVLALVTYFYLQMPAEGMCAGRPGFIPAPHPTFHEGTVMRAVCFANGGRLTPCKFSVPVHVKACNVGGEKFYVYRTSARLLPTNLLRCGDTQEYGFCGCKYCIILMLYYVNGSWSCDEIECSAMLTSNWDCSPFLLSCWLLISKLPQWGKAVV